MKQQTQAKLAMGIGLISATLIAGYFGLDYLNGKKAAVPAVAGDAASAQTPAAADAAPVEQAVASDDYAATIAAATDSAVSAGGENLTAEDARRIGEEVARAVAAQVAQAIVDQSRGGSTASGGGLSEEDARRIGEEEGRRVAQEVAAATVQQALAASGGGGSSSGLTAAEAEQIGMAAGRRAAKQVAASTAREVVRNEFGGTVTAKADAPPESKAASNGSQPVVASSTASGKSGASGAGADALRAWWTAPASGDFGLMYAGQPKGETAIALLFSQQPADSGLNQNVKVYNDKGELVSGSWEAATNPRMAVLRGLQPGRYTVVVAPALADSSGKVVNKGQHGPVYVL